MTTTKLTNKEIATNVVNQIQASLTLRSEQKGGDQLTDVQASVIQKRIELLVTELVNN